MFRAIQRNEFENNSELLDAIFRLRKRVFFDELNWDVPVVGDWERDAYDDLDPTYLVWCSKDGKTLYGALRLLPTTGPTLLHDVFHATHGRNPALMSPQVWEGTRMCIDYERIAADFPDMTRARAFNLMFLGLCECALAQGIGRLVSNFEPAMERVYRRAGVELELHGSADGYGRRPVCCASFEVSPRILTGMRRTIGMDMPVFRKTSVSRPAPAAGTELAA